MNNQAIAQHFRIKRNRAREDAQGAPPRSEYSVLQYGKVGAFDEAALFMDAQPELAPASEPAPSFTPAAPALSLTPGDVEYVIGAIRVREALALENGGDPRIPPDAIRAEGLIRYLNEVYGSPVQVPVSSSAPVPLLTE